MGENGLVQALQRLAGIDPELAGEQVADPAVAGQRLGLSAAAVQRQHQLTVQPLPQRMAGDQLFQFSGDRAVPATGPAWQMRVTDAAGRLLIAWNGLRMRDAGPLLQPSRPEPSRLSRAD